MSSVFVARASGSSEELHRLICSYFSWNGLRVNASTECREDQDQDGVFDLIRKSDVLVAVLATGAARPDAQLSRQCRHAKMTGGKVVLIAISDGRTLIGDGVDLTLSSAQPSESALRSLLSVTVSSPLRPQFELANLTFTSSRWRTLVAGAAAASGVSPPVGVGLPTSTRAVDDEPAWRGDVLLGMGDELTELAGRSVVRCAVVAGLLGEMRRTHDGIGAPADIRPLWPILGPVLRAREATASSQGFYCIPLFSVVRNGRIGELVRLHVWPAATHGVPAESAASQPFSVHSHQSHATSWVLAGGLRNRVHQVREWPLAGVSSHNLFSVSWDGRRSYSLGHRQSSLGDTGVPLSVVSDHEALFHAGHSYVVPAGEFHETEQVDESAVTATLFYFDATIGWRDNAGVVGPPSAVPSAVADKASVEAAPLLSEVDAALREL